MTTLIECPNCGQENRVDTDKLAAAKCGACRENLVEEIIPDSFTNEEIDEALKSGSEKGEPVHVDVMKWTSKIGDQEKQTEYVKDGFWKKMKKYASKVPFSREAVSMYYCATDPGTPMRAKATAIGALAYWILPIDLIPDFIPVAGFADDATAILIAYKAITSHITDEHRRQADEFFDQ